MKIREVERSTGLSQSNIRFYEEEGLIEPARLENNYRDYSADDAKMLMTIKKLRILGLTVAQIRDVKDGRTSLEESLRDRLKEIEEQKSRLEEIEAACRLAVEKRMEMDDVSQLELDEGSEEVGRMLDILKSDDTYEEAVDDAEFRKVAVGVFFAGCIISIGVITLSQILMRDMQFDNSSIRAIYGAIVQERSVLALVSFIPSIAIFILAKGLRDGRGFCALAVAAAIFQPLMIQGLIGLVDTFAQFAFSESIPEAERIKATGTAALIIIAICLVGALLANVLRRNSGGGELGISIAESAVMTAAGLAVMRAACGAQDTAFLLAAGSIGCVYFFGTMMIWNLAAAREYRLNGCFALRTATDMLNIAGVIFDLRGRWGSYNLRRTPEDDKKYYAG